MHVRNKTALFFSRRDHDFGIARRRQREKEKRENDDDDDDDERVFSIVIAVFSRLLDERFFF
jgi:AcrR family transcriptional regulator